MSADLSPLALGVCSGAPWIMDVLSESHKIQARVIQRLVSAPSCVSAHAAGFCREIKRAASQIYARFDLIKSTRICPSAHKKRRLSGLRKTHGWLHRRRTSQPTENTRPVWWIFIILIKVSGSLTKKRRRAKSNFPAPACILISRAHQRKRAAEKRNEWLFVLMWEREKCNYFFLACVCLFVGCNCTPLLLLSCGAAGCVPANWKSVRQT
jgi:hypothetical protein